MSELRELRTLRERVEEAFKRARYPSQREIARRMFKAEGIEDPTRDQINDRARQIARWRTMSRISGWGIGDSNARLLALALGLPDDSFVKDRAAFKREQQQELAAMRSEMDEMKREISELRKRVG